jgi:hypothetical protein
MFSPESPLRLIEGDSFAAFELLHALADGSYRFGSLQAVEECLIAIGILDDDFSAAVNCQNQRRLLSLYPPHVIFEIALKLGD